LFFEAVPQSVERFVARMVALKKSGLAQYMLAVVGPLAAAIPVAILLVVLFHNPAIEFR